MPHVTFCLRLTCCSVLLRPAVYSINNYPCTVLYEDLIGTQRSPEDEVGTAAAQRRRYASALIVDVRCAQRFDCYHGFVNAIPERKRIIRRQERRAEEFSRSISKGSSSPRRSQGSAAGRGEWRTSFSHTLSSECFCYQFC